MRWMLLAMLPLGVGAQSPGSLFTASGALANAARDVRANAPGDIVTIIVSDQASATATGGTNTSRKSTGNAQISSLAGTLAAGNPLGNLLDFSNERALQGQGETSRAMTLTTTISARVVARTLNGLLVLEGTKQTVVNSERQTIVVRGMIRPVDVSPGNIIRSDQIADLTLEVNGKGVVNDAIKRPFILYRILLGLLPLSRSMRKLAALLLMATALSTGATRLKELASLEGVRDNQLMGYGLVVGLNGTGDKRQTVFSAQALTNILRRMGVTVNPTAILVRNMAAVMVTATLPPFAQPGTRIDVTAAAIGDSTNLQGGLLLLTSLQGPDGEVYAAAQGALLTGGFVAGGGGNAQTLNDPTVGRIPGGAIIEKSPPTVAPMDIFRLQLRQADFSTAARIAEVLNRHFPNAAVPTAHAESSGAVVVTMPAAFASRRVEFVAEMENLTVEADHIQKVVINERTGTIVLGKEVRISPIAIVHGALSVEVRTTFDVSQPNPLAPGDTAVIPTTVVDAKEAKAKNIVLGQGATVEDLVRALQAIGSTSRDIIAVLQNMRVAGALSADIEVI